MLLSLPNFNEYSLVNKKVFDIGRLIINKYWIKNNESII